MLQARAKICILTLKWLHWCPKSVIYVLLKALPPVCMKYTAQDESRWQI